MIELFGNKEKIPSFGSLLFCQLSPIMEYNPVCISSYFYASIKGMNSN